MIKYNPLTMSYQLYSQWTRCLLYEVDRWVIIESGVAESEIEPFVIGLYLQNNLK